MITVFTTSPGIYVVVQGRGSKADRRYYKTLRRTARKLARMEFEKSPDWERFGYLTESRDGGKLIIVKGRWHNGCAAD